MWVPSAVAESPVAGSSLALIAVVMLAADRQVAWLLLVLAGVLFVAYRAVAELVTRVGVAPDTLTWRSPRAVS